MSSPTSFAQSVAAELRAEMARQRKTTTDLAYALGISQSSASDRFSGKRALTLEDIGRASDWLNVPVTALIPPSQQRAAS